MGKQVSMLVVDDDPTDAELAVEALDRATAGVTVHVVTNAQSALEFLREDYRRYAARRPDIVLLGVNEPSSDSLETLAAVKAAEDLRLIPVVVLLASACKSDANRIYELGGAAVLTKPTRLMAYRDLLRSVECFWLDHALLPGDSSGDFEPTPFERRVQYLRPRPAYEPPQPAAFAQG